MDCLNAEWAAWKKNKDFFFILYWCELCKATLAESKQEQNKWMEKNHNTLIHNSIIGRKLISYKVIKVFAKYTVQMHEHMQEHKDPALASSVVSVSKPWRCFLIYKAKTKKINSSNTSNTSSVYTLISNISNTAKCMLKG